MNILPWFFGVALCLIATVFTGIYFWVLWSIGFFIIVVIPAIQMIQRKKKNTNEVKP